MQEFDWRHHCRCYRPLANFVRDLTVSGSSLRPRAVSSIITSVFVDVESIWLFFHVSSFTMWFFTFISTFYPVSSADRSNPFLAINIFTESMGMSGPSQGNRWLSHLAKAPGGFQPLEFGTIFFWTTPGSRTQLSWIKKRSRGKWARFQKKLFYHDTRSKKHKTKRTACSFIRERLWTHGLTVDLVWTPFEPGPFHPKSEEGKSPVALWWSKAVVDWQWPKLVGLPSLIKHLWLLGTHRPHPSCLWWWGGNKGKAVV